MYCVPYSMQSTNFTLFDFTALDSIQICCLMSSYKILKMNTSKMAAKTYNSLYYTHQYDLDDFDVSKMFGYCFCAAWNVFEHIKPS